MCVICFSPKGVQAPTEEKIKQMFDTNPDGAGYAYEGKGGKVIYRKGFMTLQALLDELKPLDRWTNTNLAIHFRIGTAGENDEHTCHPFPITTDYGVLRKTEGKGAVLFHNGILDTGGMVDKNSSDTQDFVVAFAPMLKKWSHSTARDKWLGKIIGTNKLLIMYGRNKYKMYGNWERDGDLFVSNTNYLPYSYRYGYYGYGYGYDTEYYGEYERYFEKKEREKKLYAETAKKMFKMLDRDEYIWATEFEMDAMLDSADDYTSDTMEKDGKKYGYDYTGCCVWNEKAEL